MALLEGQLTWLTHIVGAILRGRLNQSSADTQARAPGAQSAEPRAGFSCSAGQLTYLCCA